MITIYYGEYDCNHHTQEIAKAEYHIKHKDVDITCLTGSLHYLLRICRGVRKGELRTDEVQIFCGEREINLDIKGDFIEPWPDDLFEAAFYLIFH
jgi:hypothetical protein